MTTPVKPLQTPHASAPSTQLSERRQFHEGSLARFRHAIDADRGDNNVSTPPGAVTVGSLHYSMPQAPAPSANTAPTHTIETTRLIEQMTNLMIESAPRVDACRFIVSLDHAIVGGAAAEFVRDGAFLHIRLLARNDAAYRNMWTHRAELQESLAASTGLTTRVEVVEVHGDGRST